MTTLDEQFNLVPPCNIEAESAVLGSMLIEPAATERAVELLCRDAFYREVHSQVFDAIVSLTARDEPVDLLTVSDALKGCEMFETVPAMAFLLNLTEAPSSAANIDYYCQLVQEKYALRKILHASFEMRSAVNDEQPASDIIAKTEAAVSTISLDRSKDGPRGMRELVDERLDLLERRYENKDSVGMETPFSDYNWYTLGLHPEELTIMAARPSMGKCLPGYTLIDDPETGERVPLERYILECRKSVYGLSCEMNVRPAKISDWFNSGIQECFRVTTVLGRSVDVTWHHPFFTVNGWTALRMLAVGDNIAVPSVVPCFGSCVQHSLERARILGYMIAEGGLSGKRNVPRFTNADGAILDDLRDCLLSEFPSVSLKYRERYDYAVSGPSSRKGIPKASINPLTQWLREIGLMYLKADKKHFPDFVWKWDRTRLAELLKVLFSCDGTIYAISGRPRIEFTVSSEQLSADVFHALVRFGITAKRWRKTERSWRVEITDSRSVEIYQNEIGWIGEKSHRFPLNRPDKHRRSSGNVPQDVWHYIREAARRKNLSLSELARRSGETQKHGKHAGYNPHSNRCITHERLAAYAEVLDDLHLAYLANTDVYWDEIASITPIGEHQTYDLTVPDGANFIANDICVHNTAAMVQIALHHAKCHGPVAVFSLEMGAGLLVDRMLSGQSRVQASSMRSARLCTGDWQSIGGVASEIQGLPMFIDDASAMTVQELRSKCLRLNRQHKLSLVCVDYLQLLSGTPGSKQNRTNEVAEIARALKSLARVLRIPVLALAQLSRSVEHRQDKRPMLSDLRESGSIEADADVVTFLYRDAYYKRKEGQQESEIESAEWIIAKQRNGPTGTCHLAWNGAYTRFDNQDRSHSESRAPYAEDEEE